MLRYQEAQRRLGSLKVISFICLALLTKLVGILWLRQISHAFIIKPTYSYIGSDFPQVWPIERPSVLIPFDDSKRFNLDTPDGIAEWSALVPGDGLVHLGEQRQPFTVSMMHQLGCLDIIRDVIATQREANGTLPESPLGRHCLNYLRQMMTCRADLYIEPFKYVSDPGPIDLLGEYQCKDWGAVYDAVEENQAEYREEKRVQERRATRSAL